MRSRNAILAAVAAACAVVVAATPASAAQWTRVGRSTVASPTANEGVMTVGGAVRYRGVASIPLAVAVQGWIHIGDPDAHDGTVVDAYQGPSGATAKMFRVTTPAGVASRYVHRLVAGELYNNSFAALSPDGQWMVAGEWQTLTRLQLYPAPLLNPATPRGGGALALSGHVTLDRPVTNVQGCDFVTASSLVCASDDTAAGQPLLQVDLARPVDGRDVTGHVSVIAALPKQSLCSGTYEAEGVDYDRGTGVLRAEIVEPGVCAVVTDVYQYRLR